MADKRAILVVEDDEAVRRLLVRTLSELYEVSAARDGEEALRMLERAPAPSAIVCDVTMPGIDGFELARRVRRNRAMRDLPIVFVTARTSGSDIVAAMRLGAASYILKPFSTRELLDKVSLAIAPPKSGRLPGG
jgi:CheY-like chemotaxis protein